MNKDSKKDTIQYKVAISIFCGFISFWMNFQPVSTYNFTFHIGLIFPMIVSMHWGWRYGLLSATLGLGCQTSWFTLNWEEAFVTVSMFTFWIIWHGWCADKFRNTKKRLWHSCVVEIPFRIFNTIILYTIFRWILNINIGEGALENTIQVVNFAAIEDTINGYIVLLLSEALILFGPIRKLFNLREVIEQKRSDHLLSVAILITCIFWIVDSVYYHYIFNKFPSSLTHDGTESLLQLIFFNIQPYTLFVRLSFFTALLTGVVLASKYLAKYAEAENFLKKLVELSPYPITVVEADGNVEYINPTFVESFGYTLEEIPTVSAWYNLIFPNVFDRREFMLNWEPDLKKAEKHNTEPRMFNVTCKDGEIRNIIFRQVIIDEEKIVIICENVSERIKAEEKFRKLNEELEQIVKKRTGQLEATNRELEAFSYSVSHDLRAPLRSIDGFSMALLEEYTDKLEEEGKDYLQRVRSASQRMGQIIDDLLSLSRISRRELNKQEVNLSEIAQNVFDKLQERDPDRKLDIVIGHKLIANCDPNLIEIILENLLSNAWKFTSKQEKPWIVFDQIMQDDEMVFCVRDNGAGFDMAYAAKLFGTFQRLHKDTDFQGYGIGLATVQRIIHRHEGRIWAEGYENRGASFYFVL
jgi:PAS domain S-box-containing protein